jgi:formylmethanofuran dehydrogenase subunit E
MGVQAAHIALREIGPHSKDEEVVAVTETDMCGVDAIQFLTRRTFGKGNLIHRDWGKNAYTFFRRSDGNAVRVAGRPDAWRRDPEHQALFAKVQSGEATEDDRSRLRDLQEAQSRRVLEMDPDELFSVQEVRASPPPMARVHATVICDECGEGVMETRVTLRSGRQLCPACFEAVEAQEERA